VLPEPSGKIHCVNCSRIHPLPIGTRKSSARVPKPARRYASSTGGRLAVEELSFQSGKLFILIGKSLVISMR